MRKIVAPVLAAVLVIGFAACDDDDDEILGPDEEFSATLTGAAERPDPVTTDATGTAQFELDGGVVSFAINVAGITGVTAAHIHGPASVNDPAGVIVTLFVGPAGGTGAVDGVLETGSFSNTDVAVRDDISMDSLLVLMRNGQSYVNVHTTANPAGEIRGQIQSD